MLSAHNIIQIYLLLYSHLMQYPFQFQSPAHYYRHLILAPKGWCNAHDEPLLARATKVLIKLIQLYWNMSDNIKQCFIVLVTVYYWNAAVWIQIY